MACWFDEDGNHHDDGNDTAIDPRTQPNDPARQRQVSIWVRAHAGDEIRGKPSS